LYKISAAIEEKLTVPENRKSFLRLSLCPIVLVRIEYYPVNEPFNLEFAMKENADTMVAISSLKSPFYIGNF